MALELPYIVHLEGIAVDVSRLSLYCISGAALQMLRGASLVHSSTVVHAERNVALSRAYI